MSTMQPSQISRDRLITLAKRCLCAHNHQYQAPNVADEWSIRIAKYVKGAHAQSDLANELKDVKAKLEDSKEQLSISDDLASIRKFTSEAMQESSTAQLNVIASLNEKLTASTTRLTIIEDTNKAQTQVIEDLKQRCAVECDRTRVGTELYDRCKKSNSRLRSENDSKEEKVKTLKKDVDSLRIELAESRKVVGSQGMEIDDLGQQLIASDERISAENETKERKLECMKKDMESLETKLAESREIQTTKNGETDDLRQQLVASDERIKELQMTKDETIRLRQQIEKFNGALGERDKLISQLQKGHHRLTIQNRLRSFSNHVLLSAKQNKYERMVQENSALSEQGQILNRRLEEADVQLAAQDVSDITSFSVDYRTLTDLVQRIISKFQLKNVHKGICAIFAVKPFRVSLRRVSKVGEAAA